MKTLCGEFLTTVSSEDELNACMEYARLHWCFDGVSCDPSLGSPEQLLIAMAYAEGLRAYKEAVSDRLFSRKASYDRYSSRNFHPWDFERPSWDEIINNTTCKIEEVICGLDTLRPYGFEELSENYEPCDGQEHYMESREILIAQCNGHKPRYSVGIIDDISLYYTTLHALKHDHPPEEQFIGAFIRQGMMIAEHNKTCSVREYLESLNLPDEPEPVFDGKSKLRRIASRLPK